MAARRCHCIPPPALFPHVVRPGSSPRPLRPCCNPQTQRIRRGRDRRQNRMHVAHERLPQHQHFAAHQGQRSTRTARTRVGDKGGGSHGEGKLQFGHVRCRQGHGGDSCAHALSRWRAGVLWPHVRRQECVNSDQRGGGVPFDDSVPLPADGRGIAVLEPAGVSQHPSGGPAGLRCPGGLAAAWRCRGDPARQPPRWRH